MIYLCRNMEEDKDSDTVWNELMAWGDSLGQTTAVPGDNSNTDDDVAMRILDEPDKEDVEEIQILTPLPTVHSATTSADPKQVNSNFENTSVASIQNVTVTVSTDPYINQNFSFKVSDDLGDTGQTAAGPDPEPVIRVNAVPDPDSMENNDGKSSSCSEFTYQSVNTSYSKHGIKIKGESQGEDEATYIEPEKPYMPSTYYQNKSARAALQSHNVKCVDFGDETGMVKLVSFKSVSPLDCLGDTEVLKTFHGTRANSSGGAAHQSISFSFDPATLTCISCKSPHKIFDTGKKDSGAGTIIFCDQNFLPTLYGGSSCVAIARL
jgi:hypothetical protein